MIRKFLILCAGLAITTLIYTPAVQARSLDTTMLINKSHPLRPLYSQPPALIVPSVLRAEPANYAEMRLAPPAARSLESLFKAAQSDGISLVLSSGYRPYEDQVILYTTAMKNNKIPVKESTAKPGYSEHQTGFAADVIVSDYFCAAEGCFALSKASAWLSQNSFRYGFIIRYPLHKEASTGYEYEPWHIRYVGVPLAAQLNQKQETLEEFYGLP